MNKYIGVLIFVSFAYPPIATAEDLKECEKVRAKYFDTFKSVSELPSDCKSDDDCILVSNSGFISPGCDLGSPVIHNDKSKKILKELDLLKEKAASVCPKDRGPWCEAVPYRQAKCSKNKCVGSY